LEASGSFQLQPFSNGISPATEAASLTLTDDDGAVVLNMPDIRFLDTGNGSFSASNEQGFVTIRPFAGNHTFSFRFDNPAFPAGFFRVRFQLCLNIGDDGMSKTIVCQHKPHGGFVCHQ